MKQSASRRTSLESAAPLVVLSLASAALLAHALRFDFLCDDAFITLRYARNFARWGAPIYNLGERVEGYTSPLYMALVALFNRLSMEPPRAVQIICALSGIGLIASCSLLLRRALPSPSVVAQAMLALLLVSSAPIAAWTLGGLETPLFAALVVLGVERVGRAARGGDNRTSAIAGALIGLATLTRPEGALLGVLAAPMLFVFAPKGKRLRATASLIAGASALVLPHLAFRYAYYGYPLPNTFYLKSSGDPAELRTRGLAYLELFAKEMNPAFIAALLLGLLSPSAANLPGASDADSRERRVNAFLSSAFVLAFIPYIASVGGDFLDLYRFFVPLLALAYVRLCAALALIAHVAAKRRVALILVLGASVALLATHLPNQLALGERARQTSEPERAAHGIEPIGWTREYALRWAAIGRFLGERAERSDWMAVGAAGAMPYYADMQNLDTFGLCDARVAHEGDVVGSRPGHQRFAPLPYILERDPVFLLIGSDFSTDRPVALPPDREWLERGYTWMEARIDSDRYGSPETFFHYLLVRRDKSAALRSDPFVRLSAESP